MVELGDFFFIFGGSIACLGLFTACGNAFFFFLGRTFSLIGGGGLTDSKTVYPIVIVTDFIWSLSSSDFLINRDGKNAKIIKWRNTAISNARKTLIGELKINSYFILEFLMSP